jgi:hypothetical protein
MPDLGFTTQISRDDLGLAALTLNDHINYYVAGTFMSGSLSWNRNQISSPWTDGSATTYRYREMVTENITLECLGGPKDTQAALYANISAAIAAFSQDNFLLSIVTAGQQVEYQCEAADYQVAWDGPRMIARQLQVIFQVPRQPMPLEGDF